MDVELRVAAGSDTGKVRERNEDSYLVGKRVWAIADGMGGQAAGATASRIAVACLAEYDRTGTMGHAHISTLLAQINDKILEYAVEHPSAAGLGTTVAGMAWMDLAGQAHWLVFNIGDSRVYRMTDEGLVQETTDHSEAQILVELGRIHPDQARTHPTRHMLTRSLGSAPTPQAGMRLVPCVPGERMLICSDGLTGEVDDRAIESVLRTVTDVHEAVDTLIAMALAQGGRDNVSAILVDIDALDPAAESAH
ncbi:MAG: protein phosphatase 2C domain-containing protein [Propionibacteriaceae bacterium]|nr:protein phosphatase 2C domain-containing protein [Propionibacteriaceae bacterium]